LKAVEHILIPFFNIYYTLNMA